MSVTVEKCLEAWTNSLRQMNAKADIVFFGDSLTYYGDFSSVFPDKVVCNLGLRGDTLQGMIDRVEQVKILDPKVVFLMAGINDVANSNCNVFAKLYLSLLNIIQNTIPHAKVIIQSLMPVNDKSFIISCNNHQIKSHNEMILSLALEMNIPYVDLFALYEEEGVLPQKYTTDGIHLRRYSYVKWYSVINNLL